jgi:hypothetical protein
MPAINYSAVELPFDATPQRVTITLVSVNYQVQLTWNVPAQCWITDIADSDGNPLAGGIPLVTGADLFEQFAYLGFGGQLLVYSDHAADIPPGWAGLGLTGHVLFLPNNTGS